MGTFDIIEYLSGLTGFVLDKSVLKRIAIERDVENITSYGQLDNRMRDLLLADLLFVILLSPDVMASYSLQHGQFKQSIGSQTINNRDDLYELMSSLYKKWGDEKLDTIPSMGNLTWME